MGSDEEGGAKEETPAAAQPAVVPPPCPWQGIVCVASTASTGTDEPFTMTRGQYEDIFSGQHHIYDSIYDQCADHFEMLSMQRALYSSVYPDQAEGWFMAASTGREEYRHSLPPFGKDGGGGSSGGGLGEEDEAGGLPEGSDEEEEWCSEEEDEEEEEEEEDEGVDSES